MPAATLPPVASSGSGPGATPPRPPLAGTVTDRGTSRRDGIRAARWTVDGVVKVDCDVEVARARLRGTVVVGGELAAGELALSGSLDVRGALTVTGRLRTDGRLEARATVRAGAAELAGVVRVAAELRSDGLLRIRGETSAPALRATAIDLGGRAEVPGALEATAVVARFAGDARLGTVRCRSLRLAGPLPNPLRWVLGREAEVYVERVEAESVYLEGARAAFVRSPEIVLGPASHLLAHEGRVVRAHRTSRVGPESWSPPPLGLRR